MLLAIRIPIMQILPYSTRRWNASAVHSKDPAFCRLRAAPMSMHSSTPSRAFTSEGAHTSFSAKKTLNSRARELRVSPFCLGNSTTSNGCTLIRSTISPYIGSRLCTTAPAVHWPVPCGSPFTFVSPAYTQTGGTAGRHTLPCVTATGSKTVHRYS
eukprot:gene15408-biopygen11233